MRGFAAMAVGQAQTLAGWGGGKPWPLVHLLGFTPQPREVAQELFNDGTPVYPTSYFYYKVIDELTMGD